MASTFADGPHSRPVLYWEHEGNKAVRRGRWKLVCKFPGEWELYDIEADRTETRDRAAAEPQVVEELAGLYQAWAERCNVVPWDQLQARRARQRSAGK